MFLEIASAKSFGNLKSLLLENHLDHVNASKINQFKYALFIWIFLFRQILEFIVLLEMFIDSICDFFFYRFKTSQSMTQFQTENSLSFSAIRSQIINNIIKLVINAMIK
jgi:hypothetical protein